MDYAAFRIRSTTTRLTRFLPMMVRVLAFIAGGIALLAMFLVGLFVIVPLMLTGGAALYFYIRRQIRRTQPHSPAQPRPKDAVIEVDYTVIDHRQQNS